MLNLMIVEDDEPLAVTLKYLVEDNPRYRVVGMATDALGAQIIANNHQVDLALVDLKLANGSTGFTVAVRLADRDIPSLFVTGSPPGVETPELALGCLMKPFTAEDVHRALKSAEDRLRGREAVRRRNPHNLTLYHELDDPDPEEGFTPSRRSIFTRLNHWLTSRQMPQG